MAAIEHVLKGVEGFPYSGLNRSHDKEFKLNNWDCEIRVCKSDGTYSASTNFTSNLRHVVAGRVTDQNGAILTSCVVTSGDKGAYTVTNLNSLIANAVAVIVIIGSRK